MNLRVLTIARTEYLNAVRSKAFLVGVIMLPVMMFGGIGIQVAVKDKVDVRPRRFAVVDETGELFERIKERAEQRNEHQIYAAGDGTERRQIRPAYVPVPAEAPPQSTNHLDVVLSEQVRRGKLFAFVVIEGDVIQPDSKAEIRYYTETPTYTDLPQWLEEVIHSEILALRFANANLDRRLISQLSQRRPLKKMGLAQVSETTGVVEAKRENPIATFGVPFVSMFLLFMIVMTSAPALLNTVLEEKMQKIAEVLVSAASPFELMMGKLMGAVGVALTLTALYLSAVIVVVARFGLAEMVPPSHYLWFLVFQLLALLIFGSMFSAIGAACTEIRDAQTLMFPAMLLAVLPMFVWMPVLQSPTSPFARLVSLIPPLTPLLMMLRISIPPGPPLWEVLLSLILTVLFALACIWASAKIFRIGILSQGQTPSLARLIRWIASR